MSRGRIEAHDRDRAEVAEGIERDEHAARADRRRELRQHDAAKDVARAAAMTRAASSSDGSMRCSAPAVDQNSG